MATLRRQVKNMVKNYSEAEVKVREATSNDPWGPSSTLMSEISDLTYNIVALGEVMRMIWKRLNDHGKNWRHVYKSLVLLDYLVKNGNEKVAQQCKEHIVAIQTLKDFQYIEEQKDQGASVREKAKQLVALLRDDERLKQERIKAFKARERFAQNAVGISSDNKLTFATTNRLGMSSKTGGNYGDPYGGASGIDSTENGLAPDLEAVRPSDANEEDLQIKLAIMLSQQEHEEEVQRKRADEAKLQIALEQSKSEGQPNGKSLVDLSEFNDPWSGNGVMASKSSDNSDDLFPPLSSLKPASNNQNDPWSANSSATNGVNKSSGISFPSPVSNQSATNPWSSTTSTGAVAKDPWGPVPSSTSNNPNKIDEFDLFTSNRAVATSPTNGLSSSSADPFSDFFGATNSITNQLNKNSTNPWNQTSSDSDKKAGMSDPFGSPLQPLGPTTTNSSLPNSGSSSAINPTRKTPDSFLGENSSLVNLDNLISARPKSTNPFGSANVPAQGLTTSSSSGQLNNPFLSQSNTKGPTISQLQSQQNSTFPSFGSAAPIPTPPNIMMTQPAFITPSIGGNSYGLAPLAQPLIIPPQVPMQPFGNLAVQPPIQPFAPSQSAPPGAGQSTNPFLMM